MKKEVQKKKNALLGVSFFGGDGVSWLMSKIQLVLCGV